MTQTTKDYSKKVIYRIPVGDDNYYGHTTQPLHKRKNYHKQDFAKYPDRKVYKAFVDLGLTANDIELIWIEDCPCENVYQAKAQERYWIEKFSTLNIKVPNRTKSEYYKEWIKKNKDKVKSYQSSYISNHKDEIMQRYHDNKEEIRSKVKDKYANDADYRDKCIERAKAYRQHNLDKVKSNAKEWRDKNAEALKEKKRLYAVLRVLFGV
jgi:hypothetical protein